MGLGLKLGILLAVLLAAGYIASQEGYLDVEFNSSLTRGGGGGAVWTNSNFSQAAGDPASHRGERVALDAYVFNTLKVDSGDGALNVYEAHLGGRSGLEERPYDTSVRIIFSYHNTTSLPLDTCLHLEGRIAGTSTIETVGGATIHPTYILADSVAETQCSHNNP
jgi:hypothetical protein